MKTGPGSAHRHKTKDRVWGDLTDVASGSAHTHDVDVSKYDTAVADLSALTARVTVLETPVPPPPTGRILYMSPTGSDAADGSLLAPFGTLRSRVGPFALRPGDTILCRGGTYLEPGSFGSTWIPAVSGTPALPITVKAYPGEVPVFDGANIVGQAFVLDGRAYMTFEDLAFTRYRPLGNGVFIVSGSQFIALRRVHIYASPGQAVWNDHYVYIGGQCADVLVDDCTLDGATGAAVQISVGSNNPGLLPSHRVRITNSRLTGCGFGVIDQYHDDGRIDNNVISSNTQAARISHTVNNEIDHNTIIGPLGLAFSPPPPWQAFLEHDNCIVSSAPFQDYGAEPPVNYSIAQWQALSGQGAGDTIGPCP